MSNDSPEEKKHPPSTRKLENLRKEGQLATSPEIRAAVTFLITLLTFIASINIFQERVHDMFTRIFMSEDIKPSSGSIINTIFPLILPCFILLSVSIVTYTLVSIVDMNGLVFSLKGMSGGLKKLNPWSGLKERFSLRSGVEFLRNLLKIILFSVIAWFMFLNYSAEIWSAPQCGFDCTLNILWKLTIETSLIAALIMIISGIIDLKISRLLFNRQHKMTDTDVKREQKDDFGSAEVRKRRKQLRDELAQDHGGSQGTGAKGHDTVLYLIGKTGAIGLSFNPQSNSPPSVSKIINLEELQDFIVQAKASDIQCVHNDEAVDLLQKCRRGDFIPESSFQAVADCFRSANLI